MRKNGFTLVEMMIVCVIIGILAAIAIPNYSEYVRKGKLAEAHDLLSNYRTRMEQSYQDNGNYGAGACSVALPAGKYFGVTCAVSNANQSFTATATGTGDMASYAYTVDENGNKRTTAFTGATVPANCWLTNKGGC